MKLRVALLLTTTTPAAQPPRYAQPCCFFLFLSVAYFSPGRKIRSYEAKVSTLSYHSYLSVAVDRPKCSLLQLVYKIKLVRRISILPLVPTGAIVEYFFWAMGCFFLRLVTTHLDPLAPNIRGGSEGNFIKHDLSDYRPHALLYLPKKLKQQGLA